MSLVDVDSWLTEYEACERLSHSIQSQLVQRDNQPKLSEEYYRISGKIRIQLKQFSTELGQLKAKLDFSSQKSTLTFEELERRQRQLEGVQSKLNQLQNKFKATGQADRNALLSSGSSRLWEEDDDVAIIDPNTQTVDDLRRTQVRIIEDQDRGLETLSHSIARQKQLASQLNGEVEQQNDIIDTLADSMENTNTRVSSETRNVGLVSRQDKTWGYWTVIVILFIAICIVALI
ncbi:unnamed protein product [Hermetia illucens]|uniref:t-SNARE coiled-coil homology domain-containing protein n=1 Tax=Hermetia illucens TaxID=343691 RepID=A0A7R8YTK5_HERIL|nr:syntaxin-8 [Hermetia illucens]CAD7081809.1 unnamed protein product [Hermetia illucens]